MSTEKIAPPKLISSLDVAWEEFSDVPRFALRYRHLTLAAVGEDYRVGVAIEELGPGRQKAGHCLINNSGATCRYVIVGERNPNEVAVYTDSNKVLVRALGRGTILDLAARRGYWDGENTGLPTGDVPPSAPAGAAAAATSVKPKPPISSEDVEWNEEGPGEGTRFGGRSKHLTHAAVGSDYHVGMLIEAPAPGRRLAPLHYHMGEEEHALILEGQVTLLLGDERYDMKAGDYVCLPAGR